MICDLDKNLGWSWSEWMDIPPALCTLCLGNHWIYILYPDSENSPQFSWLCLCNFVAHQFRYVFTMCNMTLNWKREGHANIQIRNPQKVLLEIYVLKFIFFPFLAFCLFYTIHGVLREREFELYCLIVAILILTVYVIVNFALTYPPSHIKLVSKTNLQYSNNSKC
jgi:hypothetical protein